MQEIEAFEAEIKREGLTSKTELKTFPSGAYMLYFDVNGEEYVLEYLPSLKTYGVSKVSNATFGWEGFENPFDDFEAAKRFALELLKEAKTN